MSFTAPRKANAKGHDARGTIRNVQRDVSSDPCTAANGLVRPSQNGRWGRPVAFRFAESRYLGTATGSGGSRQSRETPQGGGLRRAEGQALVETALALPVLILVLFGTLGIGLGALGNLVAYASSSYSAWEGSSIYRQAVPADASAIVGIADKSSSHQLTEAVWKDGQWVSGGDSRLERQTVAAAQGWLSLLGGLAGHPQIAVRTWRTVEIPSGDLRRGYVQYLLESRVEFDLPGINLPGMPQRVSQATVSRVKEVGPYGSF